MKRSIVHGDALAGRWLDGQIQPERVAPLVEAHAGRGVHPDGIFDSLNDDAISQVSDRDLPAAVRQTFGSRLLLRRNL